MTRMVEPPSKHLELERGSTEPKLHPTDPQLTGRSDMDINLQRQEKIASLYPRIGDNSVEASHKEAEWASQSRASKIKTAFIVVPLLLVLAYIAFWYWPTPVANKYTTVTGKTPYFNYSMQFDPHYTLSHFSSETQLNGKAMYSDMNITVGLGSNHEQTGDCVGSATGDSVKVVSNEQVNGEQHALCYVSSIPMYAANFPYRGTWYFIGVWPKTAKEKDKLDIKTVKAIISSFKVTDP